jgi:hypothetical protein
MQASNSPVLIPVPFADSGTKNDIPTTPSLTPGLASLQLGFPPVTMVPLVAGGIPPLGADFNGILNLISAASQWAQAGGGYTYNSAFSTAIGGYPKGSTLIAADFSGSWRSLVENNTTNPDAGGAGWVAVESLGVVGQSRNARMSVATAAATATFTADEIVVAAALGGRSYMLSGYSKAINLATTGAGGMDTGTAPTSGFVALYAIYNSASGATSILGTNATLVKALEVYAGANMPAGYTASALIGVWPTNASKQFIAGFQNGRDFYRSPASILSTTSVFPTTLTALNLSAGIPLNAVVVRGNSNLAGTGSGSIQTMGTQIASSSTAIGPVSSQGTGAGFVQSLFSYVVPIITAQTIYYTTFVSGATPTSLDISVTGYSI